MNYHSLRIGDLVQCDDWIHDGNTGIILHVQPGNWCISAKVLMHTGVQLIRIENLRTIE